MSENTHLLMLAGIHGQEDGGLGDREDPDEDRFFERLSETGGHLIESKKNRSKFQISQKNAVIEVEDVSQHKDRSELDSVRFTS